MLPRLALLAAVTGLLVPSVASAHFVLVSPASWAEQDGIGSPQKVGACGEADPGVPAIPTHIVTAFHPGEVITVTIDEAIFHPGHYRVVLSPEGRSDLPPVPSTEYPGTCTALPIQDPPVFPVLADGMLVHTEPFEGVQSFEVTLPADVTCTHCTLQVLEFMQSDVGASDNCFYRHCADIAITETTDEGGAATSGASSGCAHARPRGSTLLGPSLALLLSIAALRRRRERKRHFGALGAFAIFAAGCGDDGSRRTDFRATPGDLEHAWLSPVGTGLEQTRRVCARGAADPIARELCRTPRPALDGLGELYGALGVTPGVEGDVAVTTHSLGLSARTVSDLNPRIVVFRHYSPLDCSSCHRPDGAGAPARLLMRQITGPWMHWGDFRDPSLPRSCQSAAPGETSSEIVADGAGILLSLAGPEGRYGGVPVEELVAAPSGYDLSSFLFYAAGQADGPGDVPCEPPHCPFSEPLPYPSQDVLCDQLKQGRADAEGGVWAEYRQQLLARGLPVPYFEHHIVAEPARAEIAANFEQFLLDARDDAFTALSGLVSEDVAQAIGFVPDDGDSAQTILLKMCVRCHDDNVDPNLRRALFRARAEGELDAATARRVIERITLPRTSPQRMPPLLAGELPDWAIARVVEFLQPLSSRDTQAD